MGTVATTIFMCAATLGSDSSKNIACDKVDLVEVNHFYDEKGRLVFDQIIFYDWSPTRSRYDVRDWRLLKKPAQIPHRTTANSFVAVWQDGEVVRKVTAGSVRESWTQYDPELVERAYLPKEARRRLQDVVMRTKSSSADAATPAASIASTEPATERR